MRGEVGERPQFSPTHVGEMGEKRSFEVRGGKVAGPASLNPFHPLCPLCPGMRRYASRGMDISPTCVGEN